MPLSNPLFFDTSLLVTQVSSNVVAINFPANVVSMTLLLPANYSRKGVTITNQSPARLYLAMGDDTATPFIILPSEGYYEVPYNYLGPISGYWEGDESGGSARIREYQ